MRHKISGNRLGRNSSLRKATIRDIAKATLISQRIRTTKDKAKEARKMVDRLITLGKNGTLADKRRAFAILCDHKLVSNLFNDTAPRFKERAGGYTRIITLGNRHGDNAQLAFLELTEKVEVIISEPKSTADAKKEKIESDPKAEEAKVQEEKAVEKKIDDEKVEGEVIESTVEEEKPDKQEKIEQEEIKSKEIKEKKEKTYKLDHKEKKKSRFKLGDGIKKLFRKQKPD